MKDSKVWEFLEDKVCDGCQQREVYRQDCRKAKKENYGMDNVPDSFTMCFACQRMGY